uniref:Uncharacterized protein n=1 Tax=Tanacetum cinerariifolium TaxID=118510 RepID=A0A6L2KQP0_TANCI|nr:hypothetical protein [Tanacetum cinerariifolium]
MVEFLQLPNFKGCKDAGDLLPPGSARVLDDKEKKKRKVEAKAAANAPGVVTQAERVVREKIGGGEEVQENVNVAFSNEGRGDNEGQHLETMEKPVRDKVVPDAEASYSVRRFATRKHFLCFEALSKEHANLFYAHESCKDVKARYKECKKELMKVQSAYDEKADRIKQLEEALRHSEANAYQLRLDRERYVVEAGNGEMVGCRIINEYLPTFVRQLHQSVVYKWPPEEAFSLAIGKGFIDGISIGRKDPDIQAILKATPNVNPVSSEIFMETYEKLFDKRYPYVDKVARMYLLDPSGLQNVMPNETGPTPGPVVAPLIMVVEQYLDFVLLPVYDDEDQACARTLDARYLICVEYLFVLTIFLMVDCVCGASWHHGVTAYLICFAQDLLDGLTCDDSDMMSFKSSTLWIHAAMLMIASPTERSFAPRHPLYASRKHLSGKPMTDSILLSISGNDSIACFFPTLLHLNIMIAWETNVAIPYGVRNFIISWMVDGMALSCFRPRRPRMMLYGDGAGMMVNFIISLRHNPLPPKHTSSFIFPKGLTCSPEKLDTVVCVSTNLARMDGFNMLKHCSNIISTDAPVPTCILRTSYPSTLPSTTKSSSERSRAETSGNIIGTFIYFLSVIVVFLFRSCE